MSTDDRWGAGYDAAVAVLKDTPRLAPLIDALLRIPPDPEDDLVYDAGFRFALAASREGTQ